MKITAVLLTAFCLQVTANGHSQTVTLKVKNAPIQQVFREISRQAGVSILYNEELLSGAVPVTLNLKDATARQALDACLKDQPLEYAVENNGIVVKKRMLPEPLKAEEPVAVPIDISGKVTNKDGEPLAGASIKVKGKSNGTTTNADGVFVLKGLSAEDVLVFSYTGFLEKNIKVGSQTSFIVSLEVNDNPLDEVVLKPYWTQKKRFDVSNSTRITAKDIEKSPVPNVMLALQGRVTGTEITQLSGMNGSGVKIQIQGINSIGSGTNPLIVIDGVPYPAELTSIYLESLVQGGSPLNYINPNDVESIDILKDADATAIYGSKAANGAILITTKKGKAGKMKVTVNLQQGWGKVTRKVDLMNTRQYLDLRYEGYKNDGTNINTLTPNSSNYDLTLWDTTRYTNWQKVLIGNTAQYTNANISLSGGNETMQYLIGGTFRRQTTVFPGNFDDKAGTMHFNVGGTSANQKFKAAITGSYTYDNNHLPQTDLTSSIYLSPNAPALYKDDGTINWAPTASGRSSWNSPLAYVVNADFINTSKALTSNANLSYTFLPGLTLSSNFGYNNIQSNLYVPTRMESYRPEDRPFLQRASSFANRTMNSWIIEPQISYQIQISKGRLEALVGTTISQGNNDVFILATSGYSTDLLMRSPIAATSLSVTGATYTVNKYNALYGRLNYIWNNKYILNFTARRDGSSRFGDKNKFHNFGSLAAGWIFTEEKPISKAIPFLSFGKLRASYGTTGNDQILDYSYLSLYYAQNVNIPYQGAGSLVAGNIPNPYLQWEETRKLQGGIDLGFLHDRILLNMTFAYNRSSNQLINYILPSVTGFTQIPENSPATVQNTSWEFVLQTKNIQKRDFSWSSSFNLTIPRNKLVKFPGIENTGYKNGTNGVIVGQPLGVKKIYNYAGVDPATGKYTVYDRNGAIITSPSSLDRTALVNLMSRFYGGFQNSFQYKGFQLDLLFQFSKQLGPKDLYYGGAQWTQGITPGVFNNGSPSNQPVSVINNHWVKAGDNAALGLVSATRYRLPTSNLINSTAYYTYDASYIRLKNLSLSWNLPATWVRKTHLQNGNVYFSGQNLLTISKYTGLDPETKSLNSLPPLQMWTIGVKLDL